MNYRALAEKYAGVNCLCEDRTFEGLIWPADKGHKPGLETFLGWQQQEEAGDRRDAQVERARVQDLEQRKAAARARALEDIVPYQDKLRAAYEDEYQAAVRLRREAIECQERKTVATEVESAWREISQAQDLINQEAQAYLEATAFVLSWEPSAVPAEIVSKRAEAQSRLSLGQTVYADWNSLRSKELPSQQEIHEAIQKGGEHLERIKAIAQGAKLKYPAPRNHQPDGVNWKAKYEELLVRTMSKGKRP